MKHGIDFSVCVCLIMSVFMLGHAQKPELVLQAGHSGGINSIASSPDGKLLASAGSQDNSIKFWDAASGTELRTLVGHSGTVNSVVFSPDGKTLASGSFDKTIKLWDVASGALMRTLEGRAGWVYSVAFSSDGKSLASGQGDQTVKLWDVAGDTPPHTLKGHSQIVFSVTFSPDGNTLASASWDKTIKLWDIAGATELRTLSGHTEPVLSVAFSSDGRTLASGSRDTSVILWDVSNGSKQRTLSGHNNWVNSVVFSPDGKYLASGSGDATLLWDVASGAHPLMLRGDSELARQVIFSPDGTWLATCGVTGKIKQWDVASGKQLRVISKVSDWIYSVAFSPDGKLLANASEGKPVKVWNVATGVELLTLQGDIGLVQQLAFSLDNKLIAGGCLDKTIRLWDVSSGTLMKTLEGHSQSIESLAFSRDGKILASGSLDNSIKLWNISRGTLVRTLEGHSEKVVSVAFTPNGKTLISGSWDNTVKLWDIARGTEIRTLTGPAVAVSPDGKMLVSNGAEDSIQLWNTVDNSPSRTLTGPSGLAALIVFSPDGRTLATDTSNNAIKIWDVATGKVLRILGGHANHITSIAFSPDGKTLVSGSWDTTVKLWRIVDGIELASMANIDRNDWIVTTPDGFFDGTPMAWKRILWRFNHNTFDHAPVEAFYNEYYYPGLLTEALAGKQPALPPGVDIAGKDRRQIQVQLNAGEESNATVAVAKRNVTLEVVVEEAPAGPDVSDKARQLPPSGAKDIRLFRNGILVKLWRGDFGAVDGCKLQPQPAPQSPRRATCAITVPIIAGENRFMAYAFNRDNVKGLDGELVVKGSLALAREGTLHLLTIGVGRYQNAEFNLNYTAADAVGFAAEVELQQNKIKRYEQIEVISLLDEEAKKASILTAIKSLAATVRPEDGVVVYFSGHGTAQGDRFYLIPHDLVYTGSRKSVSGKGLKTILANSISDVELEEVFRGIDVGQLLLIIDACNSGQALQADDWRRGPMNSKGLAQLAYEKGMYVLTASQSVELAYESEALKHSYMTYALIEEGLKKGTADRGPKDGAIILREWFDYVVQRVPHMRDEKIEQTAKQQNKSFDVVEVLEQGKVQTPKVFYRREPDAQPWVVARTQMK